MTQQTSETTPADDLRPRAEAALAQFCLAHRLHPTAIVRTAFLMGFTAGGSAVLAELRADAARRS